MPSVASTSSNSRNAASTLPCNNSSFTSANFSCACAAVSCNRSIHDLITPPPRPPPAAGRDYHGGPAPLAAILPRLQEQDAPVDRPVHVAVVGSRRLDVGKRLSRRVGP